MSGITAFLKARLDEDEQTARAAEIRSHSPWRRDPEPWATNGVGVVDAASDAIMVAMGDYVAAHVRAGSGSGIGVVGSSGLRPDVGRVA